MSVFVPVYPVMVTLVPSEVYFQSPHWSALTEPTKQKSPMERMKAEMAERELWLQFGFM